MAETPTQRRSQRVRTVYQEGRVQTKGKGGDLTGLDQATFQDNKWENAMNHIKCHDLASPEAVREVLLEGAKSFGMWRISDAALQSLVNQVLGTSSDEISHGLGSWVKQYKEAEREPMVMRTMDLKAAKRLTLTGQESDEARADTQAEEDPRFRAPTPHPNIRALSGSRGDSGLFVDRFTLGVFNWSLAILISSVCFGYVIWATFANFDKVKENWGWPIILARVGGVGTAILTGLMYLTMARKFMKQFYKCLGVNSKVLMIFDGHKEVHIFLAKCLTVASIVHVVAHMFATIPAFQHPKREELNTIIACANDASLRDALPWLQWPACPLTQDEKGAEILFLSTPGVSGIALLVLLFLVGWTGRQKGRAEKFELFWYVHNVVLVAWPVALFIHGTNQWIGIGFPVVALTASLPICLYLVDRVGRLLQFYYWGRGVTIVDAVIRPGRGGGQNGALTKLAVTKPRKWKYEPGMYAFICMPEYARHQWHPFTISSGKSDEHVEFIIAGIGDWTQEFTARCLKAQAGEAKLPRVAIDGPYSAPTQSALARPIIVAVGAGVGITPFLSLMSSLLSILEDYNLFKDLPLKEAHFFWMTRSVDEFLFGRQLFSRIAGCERCRQKVHLHLHTTAKEPEGNAAAYLFRQAVKRQSKVDKAVFQSEFDASKVLTLPQLPWCWVNNSQLDVAWLSDLTNAEHDVEEMDARSTGRGLSQAPPCTSHAMQRSQAPPSTAQRSQGPQSAALAAQRSQGRSQGPQSVRSQGAQSAALAAQRSQGPQSAPSLPQTPRSQGAQSAALDAQRSQGPQSPALAAQRSQSPQCSPRARRGRSPERWQGLRAAMAAQATDRTGPGSPAGSPEGLEAGILPEYSPVGSPQGFEAGMPREQPCRSPAGSPGSFDAGILQERSARGFVVFDLAASHNTGKSSLIHPASTNATRLSYPSMPLSVTHRLSWGERLLRQRGSIDQSIALASSRAASEFGQAEAPLLPVAFGRPDFETELRAIGQHWGCAEKVHVYVCGNDAIVNGLKSTAETLNAEARANANKSRSSAQKYVVTYERFG